MEPDDFDDDDGMELEEEVRPISPPFQLHMPTPEQIAASEARERAKPQPVSSVPTPSCGSYLYVEKRPARVYSYPNKPSPGDLKRIASKKLRVFGFENGVVEVQPDGSVQPVEAFA